MREINQKSLRGRLERVKIERALSSRCAKGLLDDSEVLINGASEYVGQNCLVRFDHRVNPSKNTPISYLVNSDFSQVPNKFEGYASSDYVLFGVWPTGIKNNNAPHDYAEFTQLYDPGFVAFFLDIGSLGSKNKYLISKRKEVQLENTLGQIIGRSLPDPDRSSRVIMTKTLRDRDLVIEKLIQKGLYPIEMEPWLKK